MKRHNLDRKWLFSPAGTSNNWWSKSSEPVTVDLPHDFSIIQKRNPQNLSGPCNGFFPGGVAVYEKTMFIPEEWKGKKLILEFEGVYMNAVVHLNNNIVAQHPYGYTSFHCDINPYLLYGQDNKIKVMVNNGAQPNTRWYSGSGIYRHVWLLIGEKVHILPWGVYAITTEAATINSKVSVKTTVENVREVPLNLILCTKIIDKYSCEVTSSEIEFRAIGTIELVQDLTIPEAKLWSVEEPYLYTLKSEIVKDGEVIDSSESKIGIRSLCFDAKNGFQLNGVSLKLKGGCIHHDCGLLGAAAYDRAEERKVELLKASGYNAVRCAHNPPSPAFLNACDRLGMLVIDEAFDCWREAKNPNDYGGYFESWWQKDIESMVLRDRNHPSVIMWSTGNEIPERNGRSEGYAYARKLADFVRSLDGSRAVTNALNGINVDPTINGLAANLIKADEEHDYWGELSFKFVEPLDVVGYNYLRDRYQGDGKKFVNRVICGSESFPREAFDYWEAVEKYQYVIGDFVWAGIDYLGEAGLGHIWYNGEKGFLGNYPWHQAFCGDIDICGFKRPQSYYRDCVWGIATLPYIAVYKPENYEKTPDVSRWGWADVVSSWTWPGYEGKPTTVDIYCVNSEVELLLNGNSLGRKSAGKSNRYIASFKVVYQAGELTAVGYENGMEVSRNVLRTAGVPAAIRMIPDRSILQKEFGDLSYVTVEVVDSLGNIVHNANNNIHYSVYGVGSSLAVGSGNPVTEEMYVGNQRKVYEGRAMVVLRACGESGEIVLTAATDGIPSTSVTIRVDE